MKFGLIMALFFRHIVSMMILKDTITDPIVAIPSLGQVRGSFLISVNGRQFLAFRGIPYAKPPVGNLRFEVYFRMYNEKLLPVSF